MRDESVAIEPVYVSIADAAKYTAESPWKVKDRLRRGIYTARKSGRRTLVEFSSVKAFAKTLPTATFAPPVDRVRRRREAATV